MKARVAILGGLVVVGAVVLVVAPRDTTRERQPAEAVIRPVGPEAVRAFDLGRSPIYLQADPRWGTQAIGGSGEPMHAVGCTVSCISMALVHHGFESDPGALNGWLKSNEGYTDRGWVKWAAVERLTMGRVRARVPERPSHQAINQALAAGNPVIAKVVLPSQIHHWVLIVGRDGTEYLVKDPLGDGRSLARLSSLKSNVLAIRILEKHESDAG